MIYLSILMATSGAPSNYTIYFASGRALNLMSEPVGGTSLIDVQYLLVAGIERFRKFLADISIQEDAAEQEILLKVLKQYCDDQASSSKDEVDFSDLLSTWSFAAQNNADAITSAVPAALAQFFRTISKHLEFRDFGLSLCHSLLKNEQVRLLVRGLSAPKHRDFLISPCLRLLTEMMSFDGGTMADNVFSRRDSLLRRLDVLLESPLRPSRDEDRRRPTVRRMAQRLLLAMIRYLSPEARSELVNQGEVLASCLKELAKDGGDIVRDILKAMQKDLLGLDLSKADKTRLLSASNLQSLASLYDFEDEAVDLEANAFLVRQAAHDFLVFACTSPRGILTTPAGWYPPNYDVKSSSDDDNDSAIDLGLDSPYISDDYAVSVPVRNRELSQFVQRLKPTSDTLQAELVVGIFTAAPELVADYFLKPRPNSETSQTSPGSASLRSSIRSLICLCPTMLASQLRCFLRRSRLLWRT
jgi:nucleolar pre-ribosomal-associated protein 1